MAEILVFHEKNDIESANSHANKRMRQLAYITVFSLLLTGVVLAFCLTIFNVTHPKFRIREINVEKLVISDQNDTASLDMKFRAEILVKNPNFGHYEFDESSIRFDYGEDLIGDVSVENEKAAARETKAMNVTAQLNIDANSGLKKDVKLGFVKLTSEAEMNGKVYLMKVIKLKRTALMNCTIVINLSDKLINDLNCK